MKLHEYQAKEILVRFEVPVPGGRVATTVDQAVAAAEELGGDRWVVKAQIHAGGRGKGGGIKLCKGLDMLRSVSSSLLGMQLITPQTGPEGRKVRKILVAEACEIEKEYYAGIVLDRSISLPVVMVSAEGGVEIEEVAARSPEKILKEPFNPVVGLRTFQGCGLARKLGFTGRHLNTAASLLVNLSRAFVETDATLAEVNPLVLTRDDRLLALDAKINLDDNALYRRPALREYRDLDEEDPLEVRASRYDLSYIKLDGNIGCMVNGAGLAMATLDIIQHCGGRPANFLDVGGGASADKVTEAFKIILEDPNVTAILVNIFGGIMKCDVIAQGIVAAARTMELKVPLVVRLEGTNVEEGMEILAASGLNITIAVGLHDAARKVVVEVGGRAA